MASTGSVYIFNTYVNEGLSLTLNNYPAGQLTAATASTYVPTSTSIIRNPSPANPGVAEFGGQNTLVVAYGTGGASYRYDVSKIAFSDVPQSHDLQLYIFYNLAVLVKESDAAPVQIVGAQLSEQELAQLAESGALGGSAG
jgi:hypothetical protein